MGVIRKKSGARGTEGGCKYICDVCSADITSTVSIELARPACDGLPAKFRPKVGLSLQFVLLLMLRIRFAFTAPTQSV